MMLYDAAQDSTGGARCLVCYTNKQECILFTPFCQDRSLLQQDILGYACIRRLWWMSQQLLLEAEVAVHGQFLVQAGLVTTLLILRKQLQYPLSAL